MDVRERLARLVLQNASAATHAARKLRQGSLLDLKLEPAASGSLQLIAFHEGRLLGKVEPIPREYIEWIKTCTDNRCIVDSLPVAQEDHLLKLILVRLERGEPMLSAMSAPAAELEALTEPDPDLAPEPEKFPAVIPQPELPALMAEPLYAPATHVEILSPPSAWRGHILKLFAVLIFVAFTAAGASAVHYLNSPCGKLWANVGGVSHCRVSQDHNMYFDTSKPNAKDFCSPGIAALLPEVKLMRLTLVSADSPVLVTCRLSR